MVVSFFRSCRVFPQKLLNIGMGRKFVPVVTNEDVVRPLSVILRHVEGIVSGLDLIPEQDSKRTRARGLRGKGTRTRSTTDPWRDGLRLRGPCRVEVGPYWCLLRVSATNTL